MMNCAQYEELLSPHLDNELPPAQASELASHLLSCATCGTRFDELKRSSRLVRGLSLAALPPGFLARLEARRRAAPAAAPAAATWFSPRAVAFAAAAAVCAVVVAGPWRERLARAPGYALPQDAALPSLKTEAEPPPPAPSAAPAMPGAPAPANATGAGAAAAVAQSPMPFAPAQDAAPAPEPDHLVHETAAMLEAAARANAQPSDGGAPYGSAPQYTNDQLRQMMQAQNADDGIQSAAGEEPPPQAEPFMGTRLGTKETHVKAERSIRRLAAMRKAVEQASGKASDVPIDGSVVPVLGAQTQSGGAAVAEKPLTDGFWSGDYAAGLSGTRTIEDEKSWRTLWSALSTSPAPAVDFNRSRVVAVFLGARPTGGYAVELVDVEPTARRVLVRWRERVPDPGQTPPDGATAPYALKVVARSDLPVRFEKTK